LLFLGVGVADGMASSDVRHNYQEDMPSLLHATAAFDQAISEGNKYLFYHCKMHKNIWGIVP